MSSNTKVCKKCGQDKPIAAFGNYKASKDGLRPWCRECMSALGKAYYERNREVKAAKCKAWREQNREHVVEYQQQYYQTKGRFLRRKRYLVDKENHRALAYKWRKEHPEAVKASRQRFLDSHREYLHEYEAKRWREQRDLLSARNKEWRDSHPIQRAQNEAKRRAKLKGVDVDTVDYQAVLARDGYYCYICQQPVEEKALSFDHVIPLSAGGPHHEDNIKVTHRSCNSKKRNKILPASWPTGADKPEIVWQ